MADQVSLTGLRSLTSVLDRLPNGVAARDLAERLGVWSQRLHQSTASRALYPSSFARLADTELSDQNAVWLSELFRATELAGLLEGQRVMLTLASKSTRAATRARLRRKYRAEADQARDEGLPVPKDPTAAQLADEVEEDPEVQEQDATLAMLAVVLESAKAYKEACQAGVAGISREISFRQAQMAGKLR